MNEIEKRFFDAWNEFSTEYEEEENYPDDLPYCEHGLESQVPIGIYRADFLMGDCIVEVDGQETHKTKEQRYADYQRERFFQKKGYTVIRFMASEVFVDPRSCVIDALRIANMVEEKERNSFFSGISKGEKISEAKIKKLFLDAFPINDL